MADCLEQAVRCLEQGLPVQVIVSDYRLGDEDNGILAIAHLRRRFGPHIAACLMSGDMDPGLLHAMVGFEAEASLLTLAAAGPLMPPVFSPPLQILHCTWVC